MFSITSLTIAVLATWRVTHLFWGEDGPWDMFVSLRRAAGAGFWGRLLDCFYCLSLWIAAPIAWWMSGGWAEGGLLWLACSGGAILLERLSTHGGPPPARWRVEPTTDRVKEEETHDVML